MDLLLTDVVMPNASGKELANRLGERWPGIRVLFMSGYADDTTMRHGLPPQGAHFIQKPFFNANWPSESGKSCWRGIAKPSWPSARAWWGKRCRLPASEARSDCYVERGHRQANRLCHRPAEEYETLCLAWDAVSQVRQRIPGLAVEALCTRLRTPQGIPALGGCWIMG